MSTENIPELRGRDRRWLVLLAASLALSACTSSGGGMTPTSPANPSQVPITGGAISQTPTTGFTTTATLSQTDRDAKDWLNFNRLSVELLLARKFAAQRAIKAGHAAPVPCNALVAAAFNLDDRFPRFGTALNSHPLIHALIEAASKYTLAGDSCNLYVSGQVRRDFDQGDAFIRTAQREARHLHTRL